MSSVQPDAAPFEPCTLPALWVSQLAKLIKRDKPELLKPATGIAAQFQDYENPAGPYLAAMLELKNIDDTYGSDDGRQIVAYFLSNATGWRGPAARQIKAELKRRLAA